jgi:hypothetical protein
MQHQRLLNFVWSFKVEPVQDVPVLVGSLALCHVWRAVKMFVDVAQVL